MVRKQFGATAGSKCAEYPPICYTCDQQTIFHARN